MMKDVSTKGRVRNMKRGAYVIITVLERLA